MLCQLEFSSLKVFAKTTLRNAVKSGDISLATRIVQCQAMLQRNDPRQSLRLSSLPEEIVAAQTPAQIAARENNLTLLELLLEHKADVMACPISTHVDMVQLCSYEVRNNWFGESSPLPKYASDSIIHTPLQYPSIHQNMAMVRRLLSAGKHPDSQPGADASAPPGSHNGRTALQAAAENGNIKIFSILERKGSLDKLVKEGASKKGGMTALQSACYNGHFAMARLLIAHGANFSEDPSSVAGLTAVQAAALRGDMGTMEYLIELGADINAPAAPKGITALCASVVHKPLPFLRLLVQHGANINGPGNGQFITPLEATAHCNWSEGVEFLLGQSFDPEFRAPLGWAIKNDSPRMAALLLHHGADVLEVARFDWYYGWQCSLMYALHERSSLELIQLLLAELISDIVLSLSTNQQEKVIDIVLEDMFELDSGEDEEPIMDYSLKDVSWYELCRFLVDHGATVNPPASEYCRTPLQDALRNEDVRMANFLLNHGADMNALPSKNRNMTALQAASTNGMFGMALRLLERGADVAATVAPYMKWTAIDGAAESGRWDMDVDVSPVCRQAAEYAEGEGHIELAQWLRGYSPV
ncbi:ankyrin repeat-containing domain protein [Aspergillus insuetus]